MSDLAGSFRTPRFMTNEQLCEHFGLSERALVRLNAVRGFPQKNPLTHKTDSRAVDLFFDRMAGLEAHSRGGVPAATTKERF